MPGEGLRVQAKGSGRIRPIGLHGGTLRSSRILCGQRGQRQASRRVSVVLLWYSEHSEQGCSQNRDAALCRDGTRMHGLLNNAQE
jgi:hypothetical protein